MTSADYDCNLAGIPLAPSQLAALSRAGVVTTERHGRGHRYRLRFRLDGRQVAINLGTDPQRAALVRDALAELQAPYRTQRELQASVVAARQACRQAKDQLYSFALQLGFRWHGRQIRRPRKTAERRPTADG